MLKTAIPVIHVGDSRRAEAFYCERLGFQLLHSWRPDQARSDPCYMTVARDAARLHLTSFKDGVVGTWTSTVYVYVDDVDALYAELQAKGVSMRAPIDQDWGTREFGVRDPDRNLITFGQQRTPPAPKTSG
jgi:uncharacterized glyoxalase superfamily protein PhnB